MLNYNIKIIDNFLKKEDFNELSKLFLSNNDSNFEIYHNEINNSGIIKSSIDQEFLKRIHKNYFLKSLDILKELSPEKVKLYEFSDYTIIKTNKNKKFPLHDDTPNKLLSGVIYLYPEDNTGTIFYNDKKGSDKTVVEWKKNRAVFFSRKERETWHSYQGDGVNDRIALVLNLMTNKIKKVYEIEKKNYFIGNLRYKLNPYIYRFFKLTI
tara:strand:- start:1458 stop:2087 length:630 start_codon:yes stop_codon:yes gene_type:complete